MNLICGMKVIYLMRRDSLVKIVVERCTRNTTKVPTVWNINYQIIKNNNTTTQKRHRGVFPRCFSYAEICLPGKRLSGKVEVICLYFRTRSLQFYKIFRIGVIM